MLSRSPALYSLCLSALLTACDGPDSSAAGVPTIEQRFESTGPSLFQSVTGAPDGTIVAAGAFRGEVHLGSRVLESRGEADGLLASFDPSGTVRWVKTVSGSGEDTAADAAVARDGTIYVTGLAAGVADVFGLEIAGQGGSVAYLACLDPDGEPRWIQVFGESGFQAGVDLALDDSGGVIVMGDFTGEIVVGDERYTAVDDQDVFVAAFTSDGRASFSRVLSGPGLQASQKIDWTPSGVFAMTYASGDVEIEGQTLAGGAGQYQPLLLTKLDIDGAHRWTRVVAEGADIHRSRDHHLERSRSMVVAPDGSVDIAFSYEHGIEHGFEVPNPPEAHLLYLTPNGELHGSQPLGLLSGFQDNGGALVVDGELVVAGSFFGRMVVGDEVVEAETRSVFLLKPNEVDDPGIVFGDPTTSFVIATMARDASGQILLGGFWRPSGTSGAHPLLLGFR